MKTKKKSVGQITIKKVGEKYIICISGNPKKIMGKSLTYAERYANNLRKVYGRRLKKI